MLLNAVQQFLLQASSEMFPEHERQGAQHELGEEHEYHQAEILQKYRARLLGDKNSRATR